MGAEERLGVAVGSPGAPRGKVKERPPVRCFVARIGERGVPQQIELVSLETAAARLQKGYVVVGPDPHDVIALNQWLKDVAASMPHDPGDDDDGR